MVSVSALRFAAVARLSRSMVALPGRRAVFAGAGFAVSFFTVAATVRQIFAIGGFEICLVPTAAFKPKTGGRNFFDQCWLRAGGAVHQGCLAHFLQRFQLMLTRPTFIFVNGHFQIPLSNYPGPNYPGLNDLGLKRLG